MSDDLSTFLLSGHHSSSISPEMLEVMGKEASHLFLQDRVPLNDAVVKVASEHPDITAEQVKRVAEFANVATYIELHGKNKTSGAKASYPQFPLADPVDISRRMTEDAKATVVPTVSPEFSAGPGREKTSAAEDPREEAFAAMFGVTKEKTAEVDYSRDTAVHEATSAKDMLVGLRDSLAGSRENMDLMKKEAEASFYEHAKRHVLGGGSVADVYKAAEATGFNQTEVAAALQPVIVGFLREGVRDAEDMKADLRQLEKLSHRIVNPNNEMVKAAGAVISLTQEIEVVSEGLKSTTAELEKVSSFIKSHLTRG
jgi:hypothetical protein